MKYCKPDLKFLNGNENLYCSNGTAASGTGTGVLCEFGSNAVTFCFSGGGVFGTMGFCSHGSTDDHESCGTGGTPENNCNTGNSVS